MMSVCPEKFLWPRLLKYLSGLSEAEAAPIVAILSKLIVKEDPTTSMSTLLQTLASRKIFLTALLDKGPLEITPHALIGILESLKAACPDTVKACLSHEPHR